MGDETPPFWLWDQCEFTENRIIASGIHRSVDLLDEFQISANGKVIDMTVTTIESGSRWTAESTDSLRNRYRVLGERSG